MNAGLDIRKFAAFLACLAGLCSVQGFAAEPAKARKFDLVFLVGVDEAELKPGVKASVEPVFFTDGKDLVFVYDYCRRDYERIHKGKVRLPGRFKGPRGLADQEIQAEDLAAMRRYCSNQSFSLKGANYHTRSSLGTSVRVGDINFSDEGEESYELMPPAMLWAGQAQVTEAEGPAHHIEGREQFLGPKHYFLASRNNALLAQLTPVPKVAEQEVQQFVARALAYVCDPNLVVIWPCMKRDAERGLGGDRRQSPPGASKGATATTDPRVGPLLLADLDGDGLLDAAVGMRALDKRKSIVKGEERPDIVGWSVTTFVLGNGKINHRAEVHSHRGDPPRYFDYYMPLAFLRLAGCSYVLFSTDMTERNLRLLTQPAEAKGCPSRETAKRLPADVE